MRKSAALPVSKEQLQSTALNIEDEICISMITNDVNIDNAKTLYQPLNRLFTRLAIT